MHGPQVLAAGPRSAIMAVPMSAPAEAPPLQLADLLAMIRRRRVVAGVAAVLVGLAVLLAPGVLTPPLYRAEATLTMRHSDRPVGCKDDATAGQVTDQVVNTQRELLTNSFIAMESAQSTIKLQSQTIASAFGTGNTSSSSSSSG